MHDQSNYNDDDDYKDDDDDNYDDDDDDDDVGVRAWSKKVDAVAAISRWWHALLSFVSILITTIQFIAENIYFPTKYLLGVKNIIWLLLSTLASLAFERASGLGNLARSRWWTWIGWYFVWCTLYTLCTKTNKVCMEAKGQGGRVYEVCGRSCQSTKGETRQHTLVSLRCHTILCIFNIHPIHTDIYNLALCIPLSYQLSCTIQRLIVYNIHI